MGARARAGAVTDAPLAGAVEKSFLNLNACDCSIGGWVQQCVWAGTSITGKAMFSYQGSEQAFLKELRTNKVADISLL